MFAQEARNIPQTPQLRVREELDSHDSNLHRILDLVKESLKLSDCLAHTSAPAKGELEPKCGTDVELIGRIHGFNYITDLITESLKELILRLERL